MTARFDLIGLVVDDMARSLAFYRKLGLDIADDVDAEPHVEATLPGGLRVAWDTVETIKSLIRPGRRRLAADTASVWRFCVPIRPRWTGFMPIW